MTIQRETPAHPPTGRVLHEARDDWKDRRDAEHGRLSFPSALHSGMWTRTTRRAEIRQHQL